MSTPRVCVSRSELIYFLAGLAPELGAHVNGCSMCRMACSSEAVLHVVEAVQEVADARRGMAIGERYVIEEILGAGTYGLVVRAAVRGGASGEAVAIKLLRPGFNRNREALARFEREAKILAGLRGRRICRSLASGTTDAGTPYIVTELLRGETLQALLQRRGSLPIDVAAQIAMQVCEALGEAHARGIVHRDLKPDNVFVCGGNEGGTERMEIKLLDFGVARALHDPRLTSSTQHVGTPLYTSPEQLSDPKAVGPAADLWAVGVMLQELVTGMTPFAGPTVPVVCSRVLGGMRDAVTGEAAVLAPILDRCMQHDPRRRYASVTELELALAPIAGEPAPLALEVQPDLAPDPTAADPLEDAPTNHRRPAPRAKKLPDKVATTLNLAQLGRRRRQLYGALGACSAIALAVMLWLGAGGPDVSSPPPAVVTVTPAPEPPARPQIEEVSPVPAAPSDGDAAATEAAPPPRPRPPSQVAPPSPIVTPKPEPGFLRVRTTPWALAIVGNQKQETPGAKFTLRPGLHTVRLDFPTLGITETHVATIEANRTFLLNINKEDEE